jgi:hypothetical protein
MSEREPRPPQWGPVTDPGPWPWWDPIPWFWKRIPRPFPDGDPIPFPYKILEQIRVEDLLALRRIELETMAEVIQFQMKAQLDLLGKQQEILAKYK